jgi:hypothetical protein
MFAVASSVKRGRCPPSSSHSGATAEEGHDREQVSIWHLLRTKKARNRPKNSAPKQAAKLNDKSRDLKELTTSAGDSWTFMMIVWEMYAKFLLLF